MNVTIIIQPSSSGGSLATPKKIVITEDMNVQQILLTTKDNYAKNYDKLLPKKRDKSKSTIIETKDNGTDSDLTDDTETNEIKLTEAKPVVLKRPGPGRPKKQKTEIQTMQLNTQPNIALDEETNNSIFQKLNESSETPTTTSNGGEIKVIQVNPNSPAPPKRQRGRPKKSQSIGGNETIKL